MLRIFMPIKIQRLWPGLNPQTWVPEARMLTTRPPKPSCVLVACCLCFGGTSCLDLEILYPEYGGGRLF